MKLPMPCMRAGEAVVFPRLRGAGQLGDLDLFIYGPNSGIKSRPCQLLAELLARSVIDNLHRFVVPNIAGPARLVPLRSLENSELSYEDLRQAARRGRLTAHQGSDGIWRASRHDVQRYHKTRQRRST